MKGPNLFGGASLGMSDKDFQRLAAFIRDKFSVEIPPSKKSVLERWVQKRLETVQLKSCGAYVDWLISSVEAGREWSRVVDLLTHQPVNFFHEPQHFEYLVQVALPELIRHEGSGVRRTLRVWSTGCSSGEEPYTLAIVLQEFAQHYPGIDFKSWILATDNSTHIIENAVNAVYGIEKVEEMPLALKRKYLLRSKDRTQKQVRVVPEVRARVRFRRLNLLDPDFRLREQMDVIFCRNVIRYFDHETQERLVNMFCRHLVRGGYLFIGHTETLEALHAPVTQVAPAVYRLSV